jgi:hypothetical protein
VGDLGRVRVHRDQARVNEPAEQVAGGRGILLPRQVAERGGAAGFRRVVCDVHQAEEEPPRHVLLVLREAGVDVLGSPGDGIPDAAACLIVSHRQLAAAAVLPGGEKSVREQRQGSCLVGCTQRAAVRGLRSEFPQQHFDEAVLHVESCQPGRPDNRGTYLRLRHRAEHDLAFLQRGGELGVAQRAIVEISAQGEHNDNGAGQRAERADEDLPLFLVAAAGENLLELIHHDERPAGHATRDEPAGVRRVTAQCCLDIAGGLRCARPGVGPRPGCGEQAQLLSQLGEGTDSRGEQGKRPAGFPLPGPGPVLAAGYRTGEQAGDQASAQQRGLARAGRPDHDQRYGGRSGGKRDEPLGDFRPAEEHRSVLLLEARQAPVGRSGPRRPPARCPAGAGECARPLADPGGIGFPAGAEDLRQQPWLAGRRQVAPGKVVTSRAGRQPGRPCHLPDGQPGTLPGQAEFTTEILLRRNILRIGIRALVKQPAGH